jgi:sphingolipid 4-desaturase/C4-monooxygenase
MSEEKQLGGQMSPESGQFAFSNGPEPHRDRTKELLKCHPELRQYIGKNPYTFLIILACLAVQVCGGYVLRNAPLWMILLASYFFGAYVSHALWALIHECSHNLVFRKCHLNNLAGIVANLPHLLPSAVSFQRYHMKHHAFQGVYDLDADLPSYWEARVIGNSAIAKALWLLLFPVFQLARTPRVEIPMFDLWIVLNVLVQLTFDVALYWYLGPRAFLYLLASFFFSVGLHPLGARWIQEHYTVSAPQETYSYYGPLNSTACNVGYHNEHHDFPSIPWNLLPRVRETAPEVYNSLVYHTSWTKLLFRFIFDSRISLYSRRVRADRNKVALDAEAPPPKA